CVFSSYRWCWRPVVVVPDLPGQHPTTVHWRLRPALPAAHPALSRLAVVAPLAPVFLPAAVFPPAVAPALRPRWCLSASAVISFCLVVRWAASLGPVCSGVTTVGVVKSTTHLRWLPG